MSNVAKSVFFQNYMGVFIHRNKVWRGFFLLFSFLVLQCYSIGYATEQVDEAVEQNVRGTVTQDRREGLSTTLHDEETPLLSATRERPVTWKQNWFVKNIIVEFPIIGDFFYDDISILHSIKRAGKSTSMLVGGSVGMMLNFIPMPANEDMATHIARSSFNMAIGMWVATSAYNTVLSLGYIGYNCIKGKED